MTAQRRKKRDPQKGEKDARFRTTIHALTQQVGSGDFEGVEEQVGKLLQSPDFQRLRANERQGLTDAANMLLRQVRK